MKIEIWSDIMCPFCYIGKKNFENALADVPYKNDIEVIYHSFQLDDNLSKNEPISTLDYLKTRKNLDENQLNGMFSQIIEKGKEAGVEFNFDIAKVVNTGDAHRLILFAQSKGKGSEATDELFKAHFTNGENIADFDVLAKIATNIGLDKTETLEMLNSDAFVFEVASDILDAKGLNITSVPLFAIDRKYAMSGAQPVDYFKSAITQAYEKDYLDANNSASNSCDIDGNCN